MKNLSLNKILVLFFSLTGVSAYACDFCELLEYGNSVNKSYFKLEHNRTLYKGYNNPIDFSSSPSGVNNSVAHRGLPGSDVITINHEDDFELYTGTFLTFNYNLNERWNLKIGTSYIVNTDNYGWIIEPGEEAKSQNEVFKGMGDLWLGAERIFTLHSSDRYRHLFKLGVTVTTPTGKFDVENVFTDNLHMQPGRSVYGLDFSANYNFEETGFWGINASVEHYRPVENFNHPSTYSYTYAKELVSDLSAYKIFNGKIDKVIIAGMRNEYSTPEFINTLEITNTGGYRGSVNTGFGVSYRKFLLQSNLNIPVIQKLNETQLKTKYGVNVALFYYFNKKTDV